MNAVPRPSPAVEAAVSALLAADRDGPIAELPPLATRAEAYAVQDRVLAAGGTVSGWKVAPAAPDDEPRCAPIRTDRFHASGATLPLSGVLEAEVEIAFRFSVPLPPRAFPYRLEELEASIGSAHAAIEVLGSRFLDRRAVPALASLADGQSNVAVVIGPPCTEWQALDLSNVRMRAVVGDGRTHSVEGGPSTATVFEALVWLCEHAAHRSGGIKAGDVVITGARIKPFPIRPGDTVEAHVAGLGSVTLTVKAEVEP